METKRYLLCGVGGQGTVLASKLLALQCAINRGLAHTAETIGMSAGAAAASRQPLQAHRRGLPAAHS